MFTALGQPGVECGGEVGDDFGVKVLRHARILRRGSPPRKAGGAGSRGLFGLALLCAPGCLTDPAAGTQADVGELDVLAIESAGEACLPLASGAATCTDVDPQDPCAAPLTWTLRLDVTQSGCDVPGAAPGDLGLPVAGRPLPERPALTLGTPGGPDLYLGADSLGVEPASISTLVYRAALGAFEPTRCAWPFELGWFHDAPDGTRRITRLHGLLHADGRVTGSGERHDENVHFVCDSDLRLVAASLP
jgi:hypothetical protein